MIELLYLAHNRLAFTQATFAAMLLNTNWASVSHVSLYDEHSVDGTFEYLDRATASIPVPCELWRSEFLSPVAVLNDFVTRRRPDLFCKIDNDTMLPPGWLDDCLDVMSANPEIDLLGIEAMYEPAPAPSVRGVSVASHIGGIGLMRGRAFTTLPEPQGRFGFTAWQAAEPVSKAWLTPSLPVFLLDRMTLEPWRTLSETYVERGWQRLWPPYMDSESALWDWSLAA